MTEQERLALIDVAKRITSSDKMVTPRGEVMYPLALSTVKSKDIYALANIALASLQDKPAVPDGWKLVPIEATPDMLNASWAHHGIYHPSAYRTMVAVAPTPGGELD